jgi:hypothetical protein
MPTQEELYDYDKGVLEEDIRIASDRANELRGNFTDLEWELINLDMLTIIKFEEIRGEGAYLQAVSSILERENMPAPVWWSKAGAVSATVMEDEQIQTEIEESPKKTAKKEKGWRLQVG